MKALLTFLAVLALGWIVVVVLMWFDAYRAIEEALRVGR